MIDEMIPVREFQEDYDDFLKSWILLIKYETVKEFVGHFILK